MACGERCIVEFLEPEPVPGASDAALPRRRVGGLVATGAFLLAAAAIGIAARQGDGPERRAAPAPRDTSSLVAERPSASPLLRPIPALALLPTPRCPAPGCAVLDWVADATVNAVRSAFPGARVVSQMSAFAPSDMGASHPLLARELRTRAGRSTIIVDVVLTGPADVGLVPRAPVDLRVTGGAMRAEVRLPAYRIVVQVREAGRSAAARVRGMLADPGLMAVR